MGLAQNLERPAVFSELSAERGREKCGFPEIPVGGWGRAVVFRDEFSPQVWNFSR